MKVYQKIATCLQAMENCRKTGNDEWLVKHRETIDDLVCHRLPSGSGWDNGTELDYDASTPDKIVLTGAFHHMDENGSYDGWTYHKIIVTGSLANEIDISITGRDRNDIKEYLHQVFDAALTEEA